MAKKTLGYEELQWTCPNCDSINPGSVQSCESCGSPQPDDVEFVQAAQSELLENEEAIARAKAGPDIHCPFCGTRNRGDAETCHQCGGDLVGGDQRESGKVVGAFQTGPAEPVQDVACPACGSANPGTAETCSQCGTNLKAPEEAAPPAVSAPSAGETPAKKRPPIFIYIIIVVFCCLAAAAVYFLFIRSEAVSGTVSGISWERTIQVEGLGPVEYSNWRDQIPADGELISCKEDVREVSDEPQANAEEVCGTPYSVDKGSGYAEVVTDCEYHVFDDYCTYSVIEWSVVDTVSLKGADFQPLWPEPGLESDQRLGAQNEIFMVYFDTDKRDYTYSTDTYDDWRQFTIGSQWDLKVNAVGDVLSIE